jgi:hypothetical protein
MADLRASDRIHIPGALVVFRKRNKLGIFERFSKPMELFNITKSGVCFRSDKKLRRGEPLCVDIIIPGEKTIRLLGSVMWTDDDTSRETLIGAQFAAFGKGKNYNPIKSLERLREIQHKYTSSSD